MVGDKQSIEGAAMASPAAEEAPAPKKRAAVPKKASGAKKKRKAPTAKEANGSDAGTPVRENTSTVTLVSVTKQPRGRRPKAGDLPVEWSCEKGRWEATKDGQLMMYKNTGDKKWTLVEDTEEPVADNVAKGLRDELLDRDWEVLKDLSAAALREMCEARKIKVQGDNKKRNTEELRHRYYLDKLLQWLKKEKVNAEANATEAVELITEQLQSAPEEPEQAPLAGSPQASNLNKEASEFTDRFMELDSGDREIIKNLISTFEQKKKKFEAETTLRYAAEAKNAKLQEEINQLKAMVDKCPVERSEDMESLRSQLRFSEQNRASGFMTRDAFRGVLERAGLLTKSPGKPGGGQDVFHIIASSNGGPDHVDNYLYALGAGFNRSIGANFDHVNCFMAGREKAKRAATIALTVANDKSLHKHIKMNVNGERTLFTEGLHRAVIQRTPNNPDAIGEALYNEGKWMHTTWVMQHCRA